MNKMKFMLFAVAAMAAASCVKETAPEGQDNPASEVNYVQMELKSKNSMMLLYL